MRHKCCGYFFSVGILFAGLLVFEGISIHAQGKAKNRDCEPKISKGDSLVKALRVDGTFSLNSITARCLPIPKTPGPRYWYDPYQGGKFFTVLRNAQGEELNTYAWYGNHRRIINKRSGDYLMTSYEVLGGSEKLKKLTAGKYKVEFLLDKKLIDTFEFKVRVKDVADPYRPGKVFLSDGHWRNKALLELNRDSTCLRHWVRVPYSVASAREQIVPYKIEIVRDRDKKAIGREKGSLRLDTWWTTIRQCIDKPGTYDGVTLTDILERNGSYTVEFTMDGKRFSRFGFVVKNGKVNGKKIEKRKRFVSIKSKP